MQSQSKDMVAHDPHLLIGFHVVHVEDVEVVEGVIEGVADLDFEVDNRVKYSDLLKLHHFHDVGHLLLEGLDALELLNQHRVGADSQKVLNFSLQRQLLVVLEV